MYSSALRRRAVTAPCFELVRESKAAEVISDAAGSMLRRYDYSLLVAIPGNTLRQRVPMVVVHKASTGLATMLYHSILLRGGEGFYTGLEGMADLRLPEGKESYLANLFSPDALMGEVYQAAALAFLGEALLKERDLWSKAQGGIAANKWSIPLASRRCSSLNPN